MKNAMLLSVAALMLAAGPAVSQERQTLDDFSFSEGIKGSDCKIAFRATDGETWVDFGLGFSDTIFTLEVVRNRWEIVDGKDSDGQDMPLTLTFQDGSSTTSAYGGFRDGMYQGVWGQWHGTNDDPIASQRGIEALMQATSATVSNADGDLVSVNLGPTGFAANKLVDCALAERDKLQGQ